MSPASTAATWAGSRDATATSSTASTWAAISKVPSGSFAAWKRSGTQIVARWGQYPELRQGERPGWDEYTLAMAKDIVEEAKEIRVPVRPLFPGGTWTAFFRQCGDVRPWGSYPRSVRTNAHDP